jgi:hypothetical protein
MPSISEVSAGSGIKHPSWLMWSAYVYSNAEYIFMHIWFTQDEKFGQVCSWQKKEGEKVSQGETLCEVEFTNFSINLTMEEDSYVAQILVPAGDSQIPVGAPLCVMVEKVVGA